LEGHRRENRNRIRPDGRWTTVRVTPVRGLEP